MTTQKLKTLSADQLESRKQGLIDAATKLEDQATDLEHQANLKWAEIRRINREQESRKEKAS